MTKEEFDFILFDRIEKIKQINNEYDLENNAYVAFSGGKDSTVLSYLMDLALPNNHIPRVYINTGIEYSHIVKFVIEMQKNDSRIVMVRPSKNVKNVLEEYGYPMKSKIHAHVLSIYQHQGKQTDYVRGYVEGTSVGRNGKTRFKCPKALKYQFESVDNLPFKVSEKCCDKLKKEPAKKWAKENNRTILITGMRKDEGGARKKLDCVLIKNDELLKFHPLVPVLEDFMDYFIEEYNVKLCDLYYPPYNFERTGCKACPFARYLKEELDILKKYLPSDYKHANLIWKPVYDEYKRVGYRLKASDDLKQVSIYDILEEENENEHK